jgi:D-beta-D-heptose 7-phosphate kinase/D-beta-D-heptose 1-phosphate adenosyltransferase
MQYIDVSEERGGRGKMRKVVVAVSGGFDPLHADHIKLFREAKKLGDKLVVILNTDEWLLKKRNFVFMPFDQRKEILEAIRYVDEVVPQIDKDMTVAETLRLIKPHIFVKSGDRTLDTLPKAEVKVCDELGIMVRYVDTGEIRVHSSWLLNRVKNEYQTRIEKPWGYEDILSNSSNELVKRIFIKRGHRTSLHYHEKRHEVLTCIQGEGFIQVDSKNYTVYPIFSIRIDPYMLHRIYAKTDMLWVEVSDGHPNDIVRKLDDYGRV